MSVAYQRLFTADDYLAWEQNQATRHEYIRGQVRAMPETNDAHATVVGNLVAGLRSQVRGTSRRMYAVQMKLKVEAQEAFYYPDVFVTCDARDSETDLYKRYPTVIVEVLSDSTAGFDRGAKFASYRTLDSLQEYALIDPDARTVDIFRRDASQHWVLYPYAGADEAEFASLEFRAPLPVIFEDVAIPA